MITPGPAMRIVTPLPRNSPTPIAPPMASIESCRWLRRRLNSCVGEAPEEDSLSGPFGAADSAGPRGLSIFAQLLENIAEALNFFGGVVVIERCTDCAAIHCEPEAFHQPRGVHMAVANADSGARHLFCHNLGRNFRQVEAKSRHAFADAFFLADAVNGGAALFKRVQHFNRKFLFVFADGSHGFNQVGAP